MSNPFGFAIRSKNDSPVFLPLKSVTVNANIVDISAQVELTQVYANAGALENTAARYIFPVPANAAVCSFRMETADGRTVRAVVKEISAAKKEYENAVSEGKWAGLLEQVTGDVFVVSLGAIPSGQDIKVYITYVEELAQDDLVNQVRFALPTYIAERYGGAPAAITLPSSATSDPTKVDVKVNVQMASSIQKIQSPSHAIVHTTPTLSRTDGASVYKSTITFNPSAAEHTTNKDFILTIQAADLNKPRCVASVDRVKNSVAMSLTLVPQFGVPPIVSQEYVFVIDRSGSMGRSRMEFAKDALMILLKSLPLKGTHFNIASFGSRFEFLWERSREYGEASLKIATDHVQSMSANLGGTEINGVLQGVFQSRSENIPTSVFVLTDGQVWDTSALFSSVRTAVSKAGDASLDTYVRVFTLGIGDGASTDLCHGLARTGNGLCYMVANNADIPSRCSSLLKAARTPPIGNLWGLTIDWGHPDAVANAEPQGVEVDKEEVVKINPATFSFFDEAMDPEVLKKQEADARLKALSTSKSNLVKQAPAAVPDIYPLNRFVVSAILFNTTKVPSSVVLKGKLPGAGGEEVKMTFQVQMAEPTLLLHTLAARRLIADLQHGNISSLTFNDNDNSRRVSGEELITAEVVRLSEEYQLASKYAAFVAVEERSSDEDEYEVVNEKPEESEGGVRRNEILDVSFFRGKEPVDDDVLSIDSLEEGGSEYSTRHFGSRGKYKAESAAPVSVQAARNIRLASQSEHLETEEHLKSSPARGGIGSFLGHFAMKRREAVVDRLSPPAKPAWRAPPQRQEMPSGMGAQKALRGGGVIGYSALMAEPQARTRFTDSFDPTVEDGVSFAIGQQSSSDVSRARNATSSDITSLGPNAGDDLDFDNHVRHQKLHQSLSAARSRSVGLGAPPVPPPVSAPPPAAKPIPTRLSPISIARVQHHSGSFVLNEQVVELLTNANRGAEKLSLKDLKKAIPTYIPPGPENEVTWATLLMAAMMRKRMDDTKGTWIGMWEKAKLYILEKLGGDEELFVKLLDEAEKYV